MALIDRLRRSLVPVYQHHARRLHDLRYVFFELTHDWLRGRRGSHDRAVNAISLLLAESFLRAMDVITCVNRRNLGEIEGLCERLVGLGVKQWRLFTISPIGRAVAQRDLFLTPDEYQGLLANVRQDSFLDVWENRYEPFRNREWMRVGRCAACSEWRQCQGNSFHLWDLDGNESKLCHFRDLGLDGRLAAVSR